MGHSHIRQRSRRRQAGFTLVAVLLVAVILLTLLAAVSTMVLAESRQTGLTARQQQAYNLAEAGLERFMAALQQAADNSSDFPYNPNRLGGWINQHSINQPGVSVSATYVREDGQPVNGNQVPPYPHLIQVRSTGTVDQVSKTIVATVDLQFLGGLFQYALAALAKDGSGIQFDRDYVNLYPDLTINGRIYSDADIRWGDNRALPPMLQTHSMAVDLGPNSPIQSRQDLQNVPAQVPVERLGAPLAYPTYDQMVASLQTRNGSQITNFGPSNGSGLLISMFGMCIYIDFPMIRFIQGNQAILMFSNPDLYVLGNPYGKTIISEGNLHLIGLVGNSTDRTLYIAKGNVWVGDNQIPNDLRAVIETLNRAVGWLLDGLRFLLHLIGLDNLLNLNDNLIQPLSNILGGVLDLIHDVIPPWRISGYIYAPNGTVNFGLAALGIQGGVAAKQIHFNVLNSIDINYQNTDLMSDFDPSRRPELYIPQPVIVERHTE